MQRFFSTFPGGRPGAGLLLLRVMAGGTVVVEGVMVFTHALPAAGASLLALLAVLSGMALIAGFLTPGAAIAATVSTLLFASMEVSVNAVAAALLVADAVALALLGPGAHSVDAVLFGRREIIISNDVSPR